MDECEYTLCSSSTEQGEIPIIHVKRSKIKASPFPRTKSQIQYMYLPGTSLFIGTNTIPRPCDYQVDVLTTKLKKRLKQDFPYPFLCLSMKEDRMFFENGLNHVCNINNDEQICPIFIKAIMKIVDVRNAIERSKEQLETRIPHVKDKQNDGYAKICQKFMHGHLLHDVQKKQKNIIIRDSMLCNMRNKDAYIRFTVKSIDNCTYIVFDEIYTREVRYYEYLKMYGQEVVRSLGSSETRIYTIDEGTIAVYSSTLFENSQGVQRLFSGIDAKKTVEVVTNKDDVKLMPCSDTLKNEASMLLGIALDEGVYVFNNRDVYEINTNGKKHRFSGVVFTDFIAGTEILTE
ncbi:hypothetical protein HK407_04g06570 [Ordospora pajunii]|uniref:uncharacterized protein n=1 Tax=Ordospora pajunii TaxID=3039483 RepID=UPI002952639E|nr:uncharacterized protein HK407_04g06570 [Ordospora pajunii]KAH9411555.1 hypothetical protein HK407_04g06570 [Ordospora pajunii]